MVVVVVEGRCGHCVRYCFRISLASLYLSLVSIIEMKMNVCHRVFKMIKCIFLILPLFTLHQF